MLSINKKKFVISLQQKKYRNEYNSFIVEGVKMLDELLTSNYEIQQLFGLDTWIVNNPSINCTRVTEKELKSISSLVTPNQVLAIVQQKEHHLIDAENTILRAKELDWTDNSNIFLVGLSEGGITAATYYPKNVDSSVNGRVIEGWTCNAGWEEYKGLNTPYNEPVLSLVAKYDPWFQAEYLKGHCGQFMNSNPLNKSLIVDDGTQLSKGHGLMHDSEIKKITLEFLKRISK